MSKSILTIGFELASPDTKYESFQSRVSLLDWDIVIFKPLISEFWGAYSNFYQGKPSLDDSSSFQLKEACEHWRRELKQAVETGKTVIVYLPAIQEVYVATGERQHSGTGRNQKTTRIVSLYTNYNSLPVDLKPVNATGSAMKLAHPGAEVLAPYWTDFSSVSEYKVLLSGVVQSACITTKSGDKPVSSLIRSKTSSGSIVLLPDINFYPDTFLKQKDEGQIWTQAAKQFAAKLVSAVVALDKALRASAEVTPEPTWASAQQFVLGPEHALRSALLEAERQVETAQRNMEAIRNEVGVAGQMRALLYEKGKPLETAIVDALKKLGFAAAAYKDAQSEFDVVFESVEGRLLGEAEGKDSKAINVDKLRQLSMNIHEDLQLEDVTQPAKGVLFGNGFRLTPPGERAIQFTDKCITAALSSGTALVATTELFRAVQYLAEQPDEAFATACRQAILHGVGSVSLPAPPSAPPVAAEVAEQDT